MNIFDVLIVQPTLNLLMAIYSLVPGREFGISVVIFTIFVRIILWPLVKKQLHQATAMRKMQPELAKIKKKYAKNRQLQAMAMMDLYKKHNISAFGSIGILLIQLPIVIGVYRMVQIFATQRTELAKYTYDFMENWQPVKDLLNNPDNFNQNFLGIIDLTKHAVSNHGVSIGLLIIALIAAVMQYYISKQMSPNTDSGKRLRDVMSEASQGKEADQSEINAIMMRKMMKFMPVMLFFITISLPGAVALYLATSNVVAYIQNRVVLKQDSDEMQDIASSKPRSKGKTELKTKTKSSAKSRAKRAVEAKVTRIKAKD